MNNRRELEIPPSESVDEFVCANCKGLFDDLESGRDPEELCPSCWYNQQPQLPETNTSLTAALQAERDALAARVEALEGENAALLAKNEDLNEEVYNLQNDVAHWQDAAQYGPFP